VTKPARFMSSQHRRPERPGRKNDRGEVPSARDSA
jgi:hypothetical protein